MREPAEICATQGHIEGSVKRGRLHCVRCDAVMGAGKARPFRHDTGERDPLTLRPSSPRRWLRRAGLDPIDPYLEDDEFDR